MRSACNPSLPNRTAILRLLSLCIYLASRPTGSSAVLFSDGETHSITSSIDDAVFLKSTSKLVLPEGDYAIRSPAGSIAVRLSMSSSLNATGGDVIGGDASEGRPAAAGVVVGSASRATFNDGVTVRGGNCPGADDARLSTDSTRRNDDGGVVAEANFDGGGDEGRGGDALVSQYFGSNATIHGGNFLAGKGSVRDGHSLRASYKGQIHVDGGTFYGSWMASNFGSIVVTGCLSRIGTRLVGRLQDGLSLDVQLIEEGGGEIIVKDPEKCNSYRKSEFSAARAVGSVHYSLFGMILLCLRFALL